MPGEDDMAGTNGDKRNPYQKIVDTAFAQSVPLNAQFELTYRCNHDCTFCYNSPTHEKELNTEQVFEALRKISEFGVLYLTLTGGEPLLRKDFFEIAREARRLGMAIRIYSNGFLLSDMARVEKIKELEVMEVEISIHGGCAETHEKLTLIKGSFERTLQGLRNLKAAGIKCTMKCPITMHNQQELFDIKAIADDIGFPIVYDATITPKDDGNLDPLTVRAEEQFLEKYWGEWFADLHNGQLPPRSNHCAGDEMANCGTGRSGFTIDPYGNLYPCVALRKKVLNIMEIDDFEKSWNESPVLKDTRDMAVKARKKLDKHPDGKFFMFCPGTARLQTGDELGLYPQAELNARAIRRYYDLLEIKDASAAK
jgi:radical SAM protein with 4Fe4S-binding SPASM domain